MKKIIAAALVLICIMGLVGCNRDSMDYIIENEPSLTGIVKEVSENWLLIECEPTAENPWTEYNVSLNVENEDSMTHFVIGDEVVVYYDGNIAETTPLEIGKVYAITLKTPANREGAQTGQTSSARLLSVDVKVIEVVNDTTFTVEALADCSDKISTGDIISVSTDFESVADILENYQESNHFSIYFPNVGETDAGLSLTCFDAVQYDADGECLELLDIERTEEPDEYPPTTIVPGFDLSEPTEPTE